MPGTVKINSGKRFEWALNLRSGERVPAVRALLPWWLWVEGHFALVAAQRGPFPLGHAAALKTVLLNLTKNKIF